MNANELTQFSHFEGDLKTFYLPLFSEKYVPLSSAYNIFFSRRIVSNLNEKTSAVELLCVHRKE